MINKTSIADKMGFAATLKAFFINAVSNIAAKTPPTNKHFGSYLRNISTIFDDKLLIEEERKSIFFHPKL